MLQIGALAKNGQIVIVLLLNSLKKYLGREAIQPASLVEVSFCMYLLGKLRKSVLDLHLSIALHIMHMHACAENSPEWGSDLHHSIVIKD